MGVLFEERWQDHLHSPQDLRIQRGHSLADCKTCGTRFLNDSV